VFLAGDRDDDFVHVSFVASLRGAAADAG
jgi:hypothetical protein